MNFTIVDQKETLKMQLYLNSEDDRIKSESLSTLIQISILKKVKPNELNIDKEITG